ncbi:MAG: PAS domain-containing protein [Deltaproteobacteria bacterium]|nr:PAS domain-containing protein [Deltaproteobacteria bacterium]
MNMQRKAILTVMLLITCLAGMFLYLFYAGNKQALNRNIHHLSEQLKQCFVVKTNTLQGIYSVRIKGFINTNLEIIDAFKQRDRERLYTLTLPRFNVLKKESEFLVGFTYILPDATILLRMQNPNFFGDSVSHIPFAQHVLKNKKMSIGFAITKIGAFYRIVTPVFVDGTFIGAIGWAFKVSLLAEYISKSQHIVFGILADSKRYKKFVKPDKKLVETGGRVLIGTSKNIDIFKKLPLKFDPHNINQILAVNGKSFLVHNNHLTNYAGKHIGDILFALDITTETALLRKQTINSIIVSLVILILCFIILYFSFGKLIGDIENLNETLETRVRERTKELKQLTTRFSLAVKAANLGIYENDTVNQKLFFNDKMLEIYGLEKRNFKETPKEWFDLLHPDDKNTATVSMQIADNKESIKTEFRIIRPDGEIRHIQAHAITERNNEGNPISVVGINYNITERKKAEEQIKTSLKEKETFLQEIHHRVKNNLAVISSLLGLQSQGTNDKRLKEALTESRNRVNSMSLIHEVLYQSESLSFVDMNTYLSKLANDMTRNYSISSIVSINVDAGNIKIGPKRASPIGLIVNELITNSLKYAFPEGQKGDIKISLEQMEGQFKLVYSDNGVGIPKDLDWQKSKGMGFRLLKILSEGQLGGSVQLNRDLGTCFIIKFESNEEPNVYSSISEH